MNRPAALNRLLLVALGGLLAASPAHGYSADARTAGTNVLLFATAGVVAPTNLTLWFVLDRNGDGVPTTPTEGNILGPDDQLILQDTLPGMLLGNQAGRHQRLSVAVPDAAANAHVYVYLWNVPTGMPAGQVGQTFAVRDLGVHPPPEFGNADWTISAPLVADQWRVAGTDADHDGLPDAWEIQYFGSTNHPSGGPNDDPDGDGLANLAEYLAGTNPRDPQSALRLTLTRPNGADWRLEFPSVRGKTYRVEYCDDLAVGHWQTLADNLPGTDQPLQLTDPAAATRPSRFYRVRLLTAP